MEEQAKSQRAWTPQKESAQFILARAPRKAAT
jgi:hypothetical protein